VTRTTRGVVVALATVVLVVGAAAAAFGFTDDASAGGTTFVTAANALQKAGCAAGFGDGSFGYNANVTRGQDAIFQIACAPGVAYVNNSTAAQVALSNTTATMSTLTFTAGINPGGLQYIQARGVFTATGAAATITPTISVTPPAGGTASSPASQSCRAVVLPGTDVSDIVCEAGFIVPTGQQLTVTLTATGVGAVNGFPSTLAVNSAPRGNSASSGTLS
jgi:hypothetical protein